MIFDDIPTPTTLLGVSIIIASGLYVLARERKNNAIATPVADAI
jgi:drug/metabolite transporter (DMT)-like permease